MGISTGVCWTLKALLLLHPLCLRPAGRESSTADKCKHSVRRKRKYPWITIFWLKWVLLQRSITALNAGSLPPLQQQAGQVPGTAPQLPECPSWGASQLWSTLRTSEQQATAWPAGGAAHSLVFLRIRSSGSHLCLPPSVMISTWHI